jgi:hypothetical protein
MRRSAVQPLEGVDVDAEAAGRAAAARSDVLEHRREVAQARGRALPLIAEGAKTNAPAASGIGLQSRSIEQLSAQIVRLMVKI